MRSFWGVVAAVLARDVRAEWRRKDIFTTIVMFGLLTVVVFVFAFDPARHAREDVVPGTLWTAFFFAGILGLNRSAGRDGQDDQISGVVTSPADRGALYVGKILSNLVFMAVGELVVLVFAIFFFDLDERHLTGMFFLLLALGTLGFLAVGTVFAVIGQKTRLREVMLPVLLLPVLTPLLLGAVEGTAIIFTPGPDEGLGDWVQLAAVFDLIFLTAGFLLFGSVLEE
ncbi:MAG TPA: heme exporter protein CcmB [Candidatus Krumholzibacteria bacterium]|nr:heme exporter protein CcmB [Candidatus Krumholzibacteria bacterium]